MTRPERVKLAELVNDARALTARLDALLETTPGIIRCPVDGTWMPDEKRTCGRACTAKLNIEAERRGAHIDTWLSRHRGRGGVVLSDGERLVDLLAELPDGGDA